MLDDQGHLRRHVMVFVDGRRIRDREQLSDPVAQDSEIYVLQALSGGLVRGFVCGSSRAAGMRAEYMPPERRADPNIQDPHRVVQCEDNPDALWVQHHNGIFRSTDGAANWREVTGVMPSAFGFAVAVHPGDADTAWFVPAIKDECRVPVAAQMVVTRTRDGARTCEVLREGLPQEHPNLEAYCRRMKERCYPERGTMNGER